MTTPLQKAAQAVIDKWAHSHPLKECAVLELRKALDAEIAQSVEPVLYQRRMKPDCGPNWTKWDDCSEATFKQVSKIPSLHDWTYQARALYLHPPQPQATTPAGEISESVIDEFLEDYEMIGESEDGIEGCYVPDENDKFLIKDAVFGLLEHVSNLAAQGEKP